MLTELHRFFHIFNHNRDTALVIDLCCAWSNIRINAYASASRWLCFRLRAFMHFELYIYLRSHDRSVRLYVFRSSLCTWPGKSGQEFRSALEPSANISPTLACNSPATSQALIRLHLDLPLCIFNIWLALHIFWFDRIRWCSWDWGKDIARKSETL